MARSRRRARADLPLPPLPADLRRILWVATAVLALAVRPAPVRAQGSPGEPPPVGVMELAGNNVSAAEARGLTDRLRAELFETGAFTVLERARMEELLREQGFQLAGLCDETTCLVEAGKLLPVTSMVGGSVSRVGNVYSVSLRLVDVESGKVIRIGTEDCECEIGQVLQRSMRRVARRLAGLPVEAAEVAAAPAGAAKTPPSAKKDQAALGPGEERRGAGSRLLRPRVRLANGLGWAMGDQTALDRSYSRGGRLGLAWDGHHGWEIEARIVLLKWDEDPSVLAHDPGVTYPTSVDWSYAGLGVVLAHRWRITRRVQPYFEFGLEAPWLERGGAMPWDTEERPNQNRPAICVGTGLRRPWGVGRDWGLSLEIRSFKITDTDLTLNQQVTNYNLGTLGLFVGL